MKVTLSNQRRLSTPLAILLVALLLAATLLGCLGAGALADSRLLRASHTRPLGENELSPEAERIPLVAALWEKAQYYDGTDRKIEDDMAPARQMDPDGYRDEMDKLVTAGILPKDGIVPEALWGTGPVAGIFESYNPVQLYGESLILRAQVSAPAAISFDTEAAVWSYVAYLGLDALEDWQAVHLSHHSFNRSGELYSPGAQLFVQVIVDERDPGNVQITCGVYTMSRTAFANQAQEAASSNS